MDKHVSRSRGRRKAVLSHEQPCRSTVLKLDRTGLVAIVCDHGIVLTSVMMTAGENWRYATMLQRRMLEQHVVLCSFYYDINCRYGPHCHRWFDCQTGLDPIVLAAAKKMQTPLPPFHVNMHSKQCQQKWSLVQGDFSPWLQPLGEPAERFWADIGRAPRTKYMTLRNQKLTIDCTITHINASRRRKSASVLATRVRTLLRQEKVAAGQLSVLHTVENEVCLRLH